MTTTKRTMYHVTNSAGGTELKTSSLDRALARLNRMQFPGDLVRYSADGCRVEITTEYDDDGVLVVSQ